MDKLAILCEKLSTCRYRPHCDGRGMIIYQGEVRKEIKCLEYWRLYKKDKE